MAKIYTQPERAKIPTKIGSKGKPKQPTLLLDKSAQLGSPCESKAKGGSESQIKWQKAARKKGISYAMAMQLANVPDSTMHKSYKRTLYCQDILLQDGYTVHSKLCKQRWCNVCNGIRSSNLIEGYKLPLEQLGKLYFVTLTMRSVKAEQLSATVHRMLKQFRVIIHNYLRLKYKIKLKGIRKMECNYNPKKDTYNPHIHFILSTDRPCELLLLKSLWLTCFPEHTEPDAQDIRPVKDDDSLLELFKYSTKPVTKDGFSPEALDKIYSAFKKRRLIQPVGIKKLPEDRQIDKVKDAIDFQPSQSEVWKYTYTHKDWTGAKGQKFSGYVPDKDTFELFKRIDNPRKRK